MSKKVFSLFATLITFSSFVTACNSPTTNDNSAIDNNAQISSVQGGAENIVKHGLGLNLTGLPKLVEDDSAVPSNGSLPDKADLRAGCSPIYDQGMSEACVGFSSVHGLGEYLMRKKGVNISFSPRFLWNSGRKLENSLNQNVGMLMNDALKVMDNYGMVPESSFPFPTIDQQKDAATFTKYFSEIPSAQLKVEAKKYRVSEGWVNINSVHSMKKALSHGMPVVFAIAIFNSTFTTKSDGIIPMPAATEKPVGGHAIVCVGYDNTKQQFIIRNSWGANWGDHGYAYLPYDFYRKGMAYGGYTAKF